MKVQKNDVKVKSLAKAMNVLECFSVERPELGITEIAQMLNLPKSTIHNIISTFSDLGYVAYNSDNSKYYLGIRLLQFSYIINTHLGLRGFLLPYLQNIMSKVNERVFLGIPHGADVLYIESLTPGGVGLPRNILGECAPMYCTGVGKAMLAFAKNRDSIIDATVFEAFTDYTIVSRESLLENLQSVIQKGYAVDNMEHEYGIKCVAVPIFGHEGDVIAAISVTAPSLRMDNDTIAKYARIIREELEPVQHSL